MSGGNSRRCVGSSEHKQRKLCTDLNSQGSPPPPPPPGKKTARGKEHRHKGKKAKTPSDACLCTALRALLTGLLIGLHLLLHAFSSGREVERLPAGGGCSSPAPGSQPQLGDAQVQEEMRPALGLTYRHRELSRTFPMSAW